MPVSLCLSEHDIIGLKYKKATASIKPVYEEKYLKNTNVRATFYMLSFSYPRNLFGVGVIITVLSTCLIITEPHAAGRKISLREWGLLKPISAGSSQRSVHIE